MSSTAPLADTISSLSPSAATAVVRIVWLIVSPVTRAAATIVVPSISPSTIRPVRPRRRPTLRTPRRTRTGFRSTSTARIPNGDAQRDPEDREEGVERDPEELVHDPTSDSWQLGHRDAIVLATGRRAVDRHELLDRAGREAGGRLDRLLAVPEADDHSLALRRDHHDDALEAGQLAHAGQHLRLELLDGVVEVDAEGVDLKQRDSRVHVAPPVVAPRRRCRRACGRSGRSGGRPRCRA